MEHVFFCLLFLGALVEFNLLDGRRRRHQFVLRRLDGELLNERLHLVIGVLLLGVHAFDVSILLVERVDDWLPLQVAHDFWDLLQLALFFHQSLLLLDVV